MSQTSRNALFHRRQKSSLKQLSVGGSNVPNKRKNKKLKVLTKKIVAFILSLSVLPYKKATAQTSVPNSIVKDSENLSFIRQNKKMDNPIGTKKQTVGLPKLVASSGAGAIIVGGIMLQTRNDKEDKETVDDKKKQFEQFISIQNDVASDSDLLPTIVMEKNVDTQKSNDDKEKQTKEDASIHDDTSDELKTSMMASEVAKTISEATMRAKAEEEEKARLEQEAAMRAKEEEKARLEQEAAMRAKEEKARREQEAAMRAKEEEKARREQEAAEQAKAEEEKARLELATLEQEATEQTQDEDIDQVDSVTLEKQYYSVHDFQTLEEYAYNIILDLGLIEISKDPDSEDYDHSDDNEIAK